MNSKKYSSLLPLGKFIIPVKVTDSMLDKIKYLCKTINREEWSGVLFYSVKGTIRNPEEFEITLEDVFPMNKGTAGYTAYELDEILVGYIMDNNLMHMQKGHIHSHNSMNVFFSPVDDGELTDNAQHYNYYVSVVTNNFLDFAVKIVFAAKSVAYNMKDEDGNLFQIDIPSEDDIQHYYYNGKVHREIPEIAVPDSFKDRVKEIIQQADERSRERNAGFQGKTTKGKNNKIITIPMGQLVSGNGKDKKQGTENVNATEKYYELLELFIIDLLEQNTPISIVNRNLDSALNILVLNVKKDDYAEYIASTINDYYDTYERYFVFSDGENAMEEFSEDLENVIDMIKRSKYSEHNLVRGILSSLRDFKNAFVTGTV